jgi:hypothetical protein
MSARHRGWVVGAAVAIAWVGGAAPVRAEAFGAGGDEHEAAATKRSALAVASDRVVVDASEIGTLSAAAIEEISRVATAVALEHGLGPDELTITLVVVDPLEAIRGVRVAIVTPSHALVSDDGDPRGPLVAQCTACAEAELMTVSTEGVLEALKRFEALRKPAEPEAAAEPAEPAEPSPRPPAPIVDAAPTRSPLRPLGWVGVALLGSGGATLVTGAVLAGLGKRPLAIETGKALLRNYQSPGYVLLGVGGALAVTGAIMLGVERKRARGRAFALGPLPGGVGVTFASRF